MTKAEVETTEHDFSGDPNLGPILEKGPLDVDKAMADYLKGEVCKPAPSDTRLQATVSDTSVENAMFVVVVDGVTKCCGFKAENCLWTVFHGVFGTHTFLKGLTSAESNSALCKRVMEDPGAYQHIWFKFSFHGHQQYPLLYLTEKGPLWCFKPVLILPRSDITVWQPCFKSINSINSLIPKGWSFKSKQEAAKFYNEDVENLKIAKKLPAIGELGLMVGPDSQNWNKCWIRPAQLVSFSGSDIKLGIGSVNGHEPKNGACASPIIFGNTVLAMHHVLMMGSEAKTYATLLSEVWQDRLNYHQLAESTQVPEWFRSHELDE